MRTNLARAALLLLGVASLLAACDGDLPPSEEVAAQSYPVVGNWVAGKGVVMLTRVSNSTQFCSGVLINKHTVLTTARCLQQLLPDQINIDHSKRLDPGGFTEHLVGSALVMTMPDGTATINCLNGGTASGMNCAGKYKRIITYRENPTASGDSDNDLAMLYSSGYGYHGIEASQTDDPYPYYADIYMGDLPGGTNLDITGYGWSPAGQPSFYPYRASLPLMQKTAGSLLLMASTNARPCAGDQGSPLTVPGTGEVAGLHSYNESSGANGCANPGYVRGTRLRDKMGWIESIIGQCPTSYNDAGQPVKRCYLAADEIEECGGAQHLNIPDAARWNGCRGTGCGVCSELVTEYPRYFENHPLCARNTTCDNGYSNCSVNCPKPTAVDQAQWGVGLKGTYRTYTDTPTTFGGPALGRIDKTVNFNWGNGAPMPGIPSDKFNIAWRGWLKVPATGTYTFQTYTDDGVTLDVNGVRRITSWNNQAPTNRTSSSFTLSAGAVLIAMDYFDSSSGAVAQLKWKTPGSNTFVTIPAANLSPSGSELQFLH